MNACAKFHDKLSIDCWNILFWTNNINVMKSIMITGFEFDMKSSKRCFIKLHQKPLMIDHHWAPKEPDYLDIYG